MKSRAIQILDLAMDEAEEYFGNSNVSFKEFNKRVNSNISDLIVNNMNSTLSHLMNDDVSFDTILERLDNLVVYVEAFSRSVKASAMALSLKS